MKSFKHIFIVFFIVFYGNAIAQNSNAIILTIGKDKITQAEFERIYNKNKNIESSGTDNSIKNVQDYMELFLNFKLKVYEAKNLGMDTTKKFIAELEGYRKQLAAPYLTDESVIEALSHEAYDRLGFEIAASHIMVKINPNASPKDTLIAFNKAMEIYKKVTNGEDFKTLASTLSDDPSAKENAGYLGYFSAFRMVYEFENAAFTTPVGKIAKPIRTRFGYHILKIDDKRKARGRTKVAHIMIFTPKDMAESDQTKAKQKIDSLYQLVLKGGDFSELAKTFSEDKGTAVRGGELNEFGAGEMVPEFENAAFTLLTDGEFSEPIKTAYGWHIIKRLSVKNLGTFDEEKKDIEDKVRRTERTIKSKDVFIAKLKKEYKFEVLKPVSYFYLAVDTTIFNAAWNIQKASELKKPMFKFANQKVNQQEFAEYLNSQQRKGGVIPIENYVDNQYTNFVEKKLLEYEESQLETKYSDFNYLMKEYHDGILLFEITNKMVWEKAIVDSIGLKAFYEKNKQNYQWNKRKEIIVYSCKTNEIAENVMKLVQNKEKQKLSQDSILNLINAQEKDLLIVRNMKIEFGNNSLYDELSKKVGISLIKEEKGRFVFVETLSFIEPMQKKLNEAKGIITSDYQDFLEKQWISELRAKYEYKIDENVLKTIK